MAFTFPEPSIRFQCPQCGDWVEEKIDEVPDYDLMQDSIADAQGATDSWTSCACGAEYTVQIVNTGAGLTAEMLGTDIRVDVLDDPIQYPQGEDEYELYRARNLPDNPFTVFQYAIYDIQHIEWAYQEQPLRQQAFTRLVLVQYFSIIEAFLSDFLTRKVLSEPTILLSLVSKNKEWSDVKITLRELAGDPGILAKRVRQLLGEVSFHNFVKVDHYYKSAFGPGIFPDDPTKKTLMRLLPVRHDCVHRNGRDPEGVERTVSKDDLIEMRSAMEHVVAHVRDTIGQ